MKEIIRIESIHQMHEIMHYEKPKHPLISLIEPSKAPQRTPVFDQQYLMDFYIIGMTDEFECRVKYGREYFDFQEGSLLFLAPGQLIEPMCGSGNLESGPDGWNLLFHPDLIRDSALGKKMNEYTFFRYDIHEALHVSDNEKKLITDIVYAIRDEYSRNIDVHTQVLIVSYLELLLNYCSRFYGRQFITRTNANKDVVIRLEALLQDYFETNKQISDRLPTVKYCADKLGYSPNYLSDMLKKETGRNTQEHIYFYMIEKAKNMLLGTEKSVKEIAYSLGFDYPQHFSKLFRQKTGLSPAEYRVR